MESEIAIRATGLGKKYIIGHQHVERIPTLRDTIARTAGNFARMGQDMLRHRPMVAGDEIEEFWALRDIDFEIRRGEVVGIIGRNGAGKSTLLKVLSRITEPTEGRVEINGRASSLLEVGTGFHPELSGRENIFLNGAILGMSRSEIKRKFDEIVAFSEVEKFLDTPVKRYSSGMYVRLAFAVAAHLEPEILIVDEVLAVGDAEFQRKCLGKMQDVASEGRTVVFVSHNLAAVQSLCRRGFVLDGGQLKIAGSMHQAVEYYTTNRSKSPTRKLSKDLDLIKLNLKSSESIKYNIEFEIQLFAETKSHINHLCLMIFGECGTRLGVIDLRDALGLPRKFSKGKITINGHVKNVRLVNKSYEVGLYFGTDKSEANIFSLTSFIPAAPTDFKQRYPVDSLGYFETFVEDIHVKEVTE